MADDKLSIIASELALCGENIPATADDGSDEWNVCSPAYDIAVPLTTERHTWNFATNVIAANRVGASPDALYDDAYQVPPGSLRIVWVRLGDMTVDYKIINNQICLSARGQHVNVKVVVDPGYQNWPPIFTAIIRLLVRSAIYRGLREDDQGADRQEAKAEAMLQEARTTVDQNAPKVAAFNSRAVSSRRMRRPWTRRPLGWSGTDVPN